MSEVLAMVSRPTPDPNDFSVRVSNEIWKRLNDDPLHPMLNRAIQAQLAPGSVFKIITATAMLEDKVPPESYTAFCPGYHWLPWPPIQVLGVRERVLMEL